MIDCHTHLTDACFNIDRMAVINAALSSRVKYIAVVGQNNAENAQVLSLCANNSALLAFCGLHPDCFGDDKQPPTIAEINAVLELIKDNRHQLIGIGEVGLDFWKTKDPQRKKLQIEAFSHIVELALELDLPLNVHSRSAGHYCIDLLIELGAKRVLMHAFDGRAHHALRAAEHGFIFSIPPSICRSEQKVKLVKRLPLEALALETDSPVLGKTAHERNEPKNVFISALEIARIKSITVEEVISHTTRNAQTLFKLEESA